LELIEFSAPEARRLDDLRTCLTAEPQAPKSLRFKAGALHILFEVKDFGKRV
jgi:hypothetical protein